MLFHFFFSFQRAREHEFFHQIPNKLKIGQRYLDKFLDRSTNYRALVFTPTRCVIYTR